MNGQIQLNKEQAEYIIDKTGISDLKQAVVYFAELMILEKIPPSKLSLCVTKMMEREGKIRK